MSLKWSEIPEGERSAMDRRFEAGFAADELAAQEAPPGVGVRPPRFDELYAAAMDPRARLGGSLARALVLDPDARAAFEALLSDHSLCWFPAAAAAAGGEDLDSRGEAGFRVWVRRSSADPDQVYVLIRVAEGNAARPAALVALPPGGEPLCAALPEDVDGVYQLIEREGSPLVRAVREPASRLSLK